MRFRAKSLTSLLFAFLLALPMISVISKVIYVQSNKNAFESYYGETINEELKVETSIDNLQINQTYYMTINSDYIDSFTIYCTNFENVTTGYTNNSIIRMYSYRGASNSYIDLYDENNNMITAYNTGTSNYELKFTFQGMQNKQNCTYTFYKQEFNKYSYLDNVFEYAVDEVIKENNFGNIDFFSYFTSIFMSDNQVNNRYIGYVNYCLNYALMVSLAYLLFLMLMWFINFARRFLDRGMNYDW